MWILNKIAAVWLYKSLVSEFVIAPQSPKFDTPRFHI